MAWIEISVSVARDATAQAELALKQLGALAITLEDDKDHPVLEPGPGETPLWPNVHLRGLFESDVDRDHLIGVLQGLCGTARLEEFGWREVGDQDWERAWIDRFAPMKFGERLWIVPGGMEIPADPRNIEIRMDPGLAFGTGTHPTTALCLEWLDGQELDSLTVVDYGCGSGILGIAAALKGAARVLCVDNDPQALQATKDNAVRNGISAVIETLGPNEYNPPSADVVVANILARPLISLAPVLLASLREGGSLALSGILAPQAGEVLAAYRPELDGSGRQDREDWVLLHGRWKAAVPARDSREP